ncbi:MAG: helix-turn-helix domain-containing protein [Candidatus Omnitrophota bacterium]
MAEEKLLTVRDASLLLGITEKEVMDLAESGKLPAYKVGGVYLRFKRSQIDDYRKTIKPSERILRPASPYSFRDRLSDFFYFNDFYILSCLIILLIVLIIFRG